MLWTALIAAFILGAALAVGAAAGGLQGIILGGAVLVVAVAGAAVWTLAGVGTRRQRGVRP